MEARKKIAIIVAAGSGSRMGATMPKQLLPLNEKPIIIHTIEKFLHSFSDLQIILVLSPIVYQKLCKDFGDLMHSDRIHCVDGGMSRFHSVQNGIMAAPDNAIIFVHDGVRCLVSENLIHQCFHDASQYGSAIPAIKIVDSLRKVENENSHIINRDNIRAIQTPQTFQSEILKAAFQQPYQEIFTDEASVVEAFGHSIHLVEGEETNIKITRPLDLIIAKAILETQNSME